MSRRKSRKIKVEYVEIEKLKPAKYNPRRITPEALNKLIKSLDHFGPVDPIIARRSDHIVIGGHQRLRALKELGHKRVPVVFLDIDDARMKALNIQLNNPNSQGEWDESKLTPLLLELKPELEDIEITGFDLTEYNQLAELPAFEPADIEEQQRLDRKKKVICPGCGHEFTP